VRTLWPSSRRKYGNQEKESAVKLSARNQIPARVVAINAGEAIANVELDAGGVRLVASVTVEAVRDLGITEGREVTAVIKASDVLLGVAE
jgi:molybdopterin-binding protein